MTTLNESAEFVGDIFTEDMLYAITIRSPVARGVLLAIECPDLPDSCRLITAEHIPGKNELSGFPVPVLADKLLFYVGQPVAILAGPEESALKEIASRVKVTAEEKEPVFFHKRTVPIANNDENTDAEVLGEVPGENFGEVFCENFGEVFREVLVKRNIVSGEPEEAFEKSHTIVAGTYTTGIQAHWYPEPHGAVAIPEAADSPPSPPRLVIHTATQWPYHVKRSVEQVLGWGDGSVTVHPSRAAMNLDGKIWYPSLVACHAALASSFTASPVRLIFTGEEDFLYSPKRNEAEIEIRAAIGEKGEILASISRLTLNIGAHGIFADEIIDHTCLGSLGLYHHPAFRIDAEGIRANIPAQGPMAGFGLSQGFFAAERHASRVADSLGQDPAQWRKNNFLKNKQSLAIGTNLKNSMPLPELIDAASAMSDYSRKWASYELLRSSRRGESRDFSGEPSRGIGIAIACQGNGFLHNDSGNSNCAVETRLELDGSLEIRTSLPEHSAAADTWRNLARDILGVEGDLVRFINNTRDAPDSGAATLSRNISVVTRLVEKCCAAIRNQRFRRPLPITVKRSAKSAKEPAWGAPVKNIESEAFACPSWGAAVAEIEIDPVSLSPIVRGIWFVVDGGKILSQRHARSALRAGIIQALGWTSREQLFYKEGKIPPELYRSYDIITPVKIPPIHVDFIWNDAAPPKGIGDLPFCCVPAAYVQAVSQAMDYHFEKIPLDARDIWEAAKRAHKGDTA